MGRIKANQKEDKPAESFSTGEIKEEKPIPLEKGSLVASRIFIEKLKKELKDENISDAVYVAFRTVTNPVDTEENYRKIWNTTFKRQ